MRENWLDHIRYWDIEKIVKSKCRKVDDIIADFSSSSRGEKRWKVKYLSAGRTYEFELGEFGDMSSLNPFDNAEFFKIARKKNSGRIIDGLTFEQAFYKAYEEAIVDHRFDLAEEAKANVMSPDFEERLKNIEEVYENLILNLDKFAKKFKFEPADEEDCEM